MNEIRKELENLKESISDFFWNWELKDYLAATAVLIVAGFILFLFIQPKEHFLVDGIIVDKSYLPSYVTSNPVTTCDSKGNCNTTIITQYHPEVFSILVKTDVDIQTHSVSRTFYGFHEISDPIILSCYKGKIIKAVLCGVQE